MEDFINVNPDTPLTEYCRNASNKEGDTFVGIKSEFIDGKHSLSINFPLGFEISQNEETVRDEIISLISVLQVYNDQQSRISKIMPEQILKTVRFPVQAYFTVLVDFLNNGYYQITEEQFKQGIAGPINWSRTIKMETPVAQKNGVFYTKYRVKHHSETDKDLITEINKYCVYQSYLRLGWIYKLPLPTEPHQRRQINVYQNYLEGALLRTNRDKDKQLFTAMADILNFENSANNPDQFYFGTNRFEYIWEKLIQETYGNVRKEDYFPKTKWRLKFGSERDNTALEPDTVMKESNDIYILDAKYYKYGVTRIPSDLPNSSSINKQITYGEHVANNMLKEDEIVYNAFLMPYDSSEQPYNEEKGHYYSIGEGVSSWKPSNETYQRVQGILVDVKFLIKNTIKPNNSEILKLSNAIKESLEENKRRE
ncbi:LlaJI family restriction endonuclease [Facklamia hominis]